MASLPPPITATAAYSPSSTLISSLSSYTFFKKPAQISVVKKHHHLFKVSCKSINDDQNSSNTTSNTSSETSLEKLDRRNVVIGLGGLCSAASLGVPTTRLALANPVLPDFTNCKTATTDDTKQPIECCPPQATQIIDFKPTQPNKMRVRPPAHLVDSEYLEKYSRAYHLMKELPKDDPRNFTQQANVHCAYCDGGYEQKGFPDAKYDVHFSWLFFPFHRWYLYFHEKILGNLIGDPDFTLPFWNWDDPNGMQIPPMYIDNSILYNSTRTSDHLPPALIDLQNGDNVITKQEVDKNLYLMYNQMITNSSDPQSFFGKPYGPNDKPNPGAGTIESTHNIVHKWVGGDMGAFYSSGRDPLFYAHHCNVDRMWNIWKGIQELNHQSTEFNNANWLDASFTFYDENKQLVRVKVRDCLDSGNLGYTYQYVCPLWPYFRPKNKVSKKVRKERKAARTIIRQVAPPPVADVLPIKLDDKTIVRVTVPRPKKSLTKKGEKLEIEGIEVDSGVFAQFDVYVNDEEDGEIGPENTEYAGSFVTLPMKMGLKTTFSLSLTNLLEGLGSEDDDSVVVTLVPKLKSGVQVIIGGIKIVS